MAYFNRDNRDNRGGGRKFNKGGFGGDRGGFNKPRPFMHKAVCSSCGNECEVPFKPTGDRPVYCSNCFKKPAGEGHGNFGGNRDNFKSEGPRFASAHHENHGHGHHDGLKQQIEQMNAKLDKILAVMTSSAPKMEKTENVEVVKEEKKPKVAKKPLVKAKKKGKK